MCATLLWRMGSFQLWRFSPYSAIENTKFVLTKEQKSITKVW